jgi:hypothetical protein
MPRWRAISAIATAYCSSSPIICSESSSVVMRLALCPERLRASSSLPLEKKPFSCRLRSSWRTCSIGTVSSPTNSLALDPIMLGTCSGSGRFSGAKSYWASCPSSGFAGKDTLTE